jgi:hypothetical protein
MTLAPACRGVAVALAIAALVDPRVLLPSRQRAGIRVRVDDAAQRGRLIDRLAAAGFTDAADGEAATVTAFDDGIAALPSGTPIYALIAPGRPDVAIVGASVSRSRVARQAVAVAVTIRGRGMKGRTSHVRLLDAGMTVGSATHTWAVDDDTWRTTLSYLPAGEDAARLRVTVDAPAGARTTGGGVDVLAPPTRGPIRTLVFDPSVSWTGTFVRRTLEAQPGFAVDSVQRATKAASIRAGVTPSALTRAELAPYELLLLGSPDDLDAAVVDAVRWFVEERGGIAVLVPDRSPSRRSDLLPGVSFDSKVLETPAAMTGGLFAAELAVPRSPLPPSTVSAEETAGVPIVAGWRRGLGAVVFSGALDAWRYRDRSDNAFARFWTSALLEQALTVSPILEVRASPAVIRPGDVVHVSARLRATELPPAADRIELPAAGARALARERDGPRAQGDTTTDAAVRLWPGPTPGVYEGEWRPVVEGTYAIDATVGSATAAAVVQVAADAASPQPSEEAMRTAAAASGGGVFADEASLVRALAERFPVTRAGRPFHPARTPWWSGAFALLVSAEWALRRRRGLP